jgi:hypothetical protein
VKLSKIHKIAYASLAALLIIILGIALIKSNHFDAPKKLAVTQQSIEKRLATLPSVQATPAPKASPSPTPKLTPQPTTTPAPKSTPTASTPNLTNTGPGSLIGLYIVTSVIGFTLFRSTRRSKF